MRLPGSVAPRADLGVLAVSFPETRSVREDTFAGEMEVGCEAATSTLVLGGEQWCALEFRGARLLDENIDAGFRIKLLILSLLDSCGCS